MRAELAPFRAAVTAFRPPTAVIDVPQRDVPQSRDADCANQNFRRFLSKSSFVEI
jgi:hypothetical protein